MPEKALRSSRLLLSIKAFCMFFLIVSSFFLFHSVINPLIPSSVFKQFFVETQLVYYNLKGNDEPSLPVVVPLPLSMIAHHTHKSEEILVDPHQTTSTDKKINDSLGNEGCSLNKALLGLYMYDMPPEFHFGLLDWKAGPNGIWPDLIFVIQSMFHGILVA